jgi:hypothetical protein
MVRCINGRMELSIYAHPWDLRALEPDGGLARLRDLGFGEVALAVSYHAGRWLTPWHPEGMVRFLEDGTVHFRPSRDYGMLQPKVSSEVPPTGRSPLEWLCEEAAKVGIRTRAWAVLTHNSRLGEEHPSMCVTNAFGDRYTYALCPAQPAVKHYTKALVEDLAAHDGLASIELESFGWLGHRHNSHHDKSSFAAEAYSDVLLSVCFCSACRDGMAATKYEGTGTIGLQTVEEWRLAFAAALRRRFMGGDCMEPPEAKLTTVEVLARLLAEFGERITGFIGHRLITAILSLGALQGVRLRGRRLAVQTNYDALRGTSAMPLAPVGQFVDEAVLTTYAEGPDGVAAALPHLKAAHGEALHPPLPPEARPRLRLSLHPRAPQYRTDDDLRRVHELCAQQGVGTIAIYHLGLLPWRTIERVAAALR